MKKTEASLCAFDSIYLSGTLLLFVLTTITTRVFDHRSSSRALRSRQEKIWKPRPIIYRCRQNPSQFQSINDGRTDGQQERTEEAADLDTYVEYRRRGGVVWCGARRGRWNVHPCSSFFQSVVGWLWVSAIFDGTSIQTIRVRYRSTGSIAHFPWNRSRTLVRVFRKWKE